MKKFISIFLSLLLIFTFSTQAFASVGDDDPTEQSGIEDSFAIPPLTFTIGRFFLYRFQILLLCFLKG